MKHLSRNCIGIGATCILLFFSFQKPVFGQISATFVDINPNSSSLDGSDPDGSSGGRVNGLGCAHDGSAYYAASEWGGIYRSNDQGRNWFRLNGHIPTATWDVEVDPSNNNRVYATSFYDGRVNSLAGINVSNDGGVTWVKPATAVPPGPPYTTLTRSQEPCAFGICIDPANSNNVYIGTNTGLAISNNAGVTWHFVDPTPGNTADNIWDVVVHHGGIIDVVGDDGHCRSTNGGVTWTVPGTLASGRSSIAASPDESYVLFAAVGKSLFQTTDAGATWTTMTNPSPQGRIPFVETNDQPGSAYDLWFGDISIWRTSCTTPASPAFGGAGRAPANSWSTGFTRSAGGASTGGHDDTGGILFDPTVSVGACPVLYCCDGGVFFNTLTGASCQSPVWEQPTTTPHGLWAFGMSGAVRAGAVPEDLYFGNQDDGSFATTNAGSNTPGWTNGQCCDGFDFNSDNTNVLNTICCFAGTTRMFLSGPGFSGTAQINPKPPGSFNGFAFDDIIDQFGAASYAVVTNSGLYVTTNINASPIVWSAALGAGTFPGLCGVKSSANGSTPVFYGLSSSISCDDRTPNAKQLWRYSGTTTTGTWTQINPPGTGGFGIFDVDPGNFNRIIASFLPNVGRPRMIMSTDGGTTWTNLTELDKLMDGNGIFRAQTQAGPSNFTGFQGYAQPSLVAFDPSEPKLIVAGAIDAGLFISNDGGVCWKLISDPIHPATSGIPNITRPHFAYFSHQPDAGGKKIVQLYIGSQGRGVWRVDLTIDGYTNIAVTGTVIPPNCPGGCDGKINLTVSSATGAQSFRWSNGQSTQNATALCAGLYSVVVSDQLGCTSANFTMPDGVDITPPVITCPANRTQSCEISTDPATTGNPVVTDNCTVTSITHADVKIPGSCPFNFTLNRTWTAKDQSNNQANCLQVIKVQDITPPVIVCPLDITVECDTTPAKTGVATVTDNCDPNPQITGHSDVDAGGFCEWFCVLKRTWNAKDNCGNISKCVQTITKNTAPLIDQALSQGDVLVMGTTNSIVRFPPGVGICVIKMLPPTGNKPPHGLTFKKSTVSTTDCKPGTNPVDATGRIENALFGEALKMAIIAKLKPAIDAKKLSDFSCPLNTVVRQHMKPDPDIHELIRIANSTLGNDSAIAGGQLNILLDYLKCINQSLDICK